MLIKEKEFFSQKLKKKKLTISVSNFFEILNQKYYISIFSFFSNQDLDFCLKNFFKVNLTEISTKKYAASKG